MTLRSRVFLGAGLMLALIIAGFWFGIRPMVANAIIEERMTVVNQFHGYFLDQNDRFFEDARKTAFQLKDWLGSGPEAYRSAFIFSVNLNKTLITQEVIAPGEPDALSSKNNDYTGPIPEFTALTFTESDSGLAYCWSKPDQDLFLFVIREYTTVNEIRVVVYTCFDASYIIGQLKSYNLGIPYSLSFSDPTSVIYSTHKQASLRTFNSGAGTQIQTEESDSGKIFLLTGQFQTFPFGLAIGVAEHDITAPVDRLFLLVLGLLILLSAVFFAGFQFYFVAITKPVRELVASIEPIQKLKFSAPIADVKFAELKPIASALESMRTILDEYDRMKTQKLILAESRNQFMINYIDDFLAIANETGEFHFLNQKMQDLLSHHNLLKPSYSMAEMVNLLSVNHVKQPVHVDHSDLEYNISVQQGESKLATGETTRDLICRYQFVQIREKISDKMLGSLLILHDLTEDRALEELKKDMMNIMVHELRNPITSIIGFSDIMLDDGGLDEERTKYIDIIRKSGEKLSALINRFLDVQRLESGKIDIQFSQVNLKATVEDLVMNFIPQLEEKELKVNLSVGNEIPFVEASPELMSEAVQNLLSNAIKYGDPGRTIDIKLIAQPNAVTFSITDHGYGIPASEQSRLFTKFFRVKSNEKAYKQVGTGLGLAYVKEIISRHNGNITLESSKEIGCRFTITLPTRQEKTFEN
ncbi:MAG: HAMP domain-containing histidine kinase [Bacteroidetes bacterium]|nr:HAMP domain-containing histidine kinase [Bacteroidota bacterium]